MNCPNYEQVTDAYLSGEIDSPEWRSHLDCCPNCAAKLQSESDFDLILRHAVNEERLQTRQLEAHVRAAIHQPRSRWHSPMFVLRYGLAAMVVFGTLGLATFGYAKGRMDRTATCADAADDHREEIIEKAPRKWRVNPKDVQALSQRVVGDPSVPERVTPAGYHLVGARICILHDKDYLHLDFSDGNNEISLFVRNQSPANLADRVLSWFQSDGESVENVETLNVGATQKHNLSLVVVSTTPVPDVQKLVEQAANQL
jgi:anti-sigma factor RsiW